MSETKGGHERETEIIEQREYGGFEKIPLNNIE